MPLHHTLLLPSSDRNPLTFESPLERFDNLSRNRTEKVDVSKYASTYFLGTDYTDFTDKFNVNIH